MLLPWIISANDISIFLILLGVGLVSNVVANISSASLLLPYIPCIIAATSPPAVAAILRISSSPILIAVIEYGEIELNLFPDLAGVLKLLIYPIPQARKCGILLTTM